MQDLNLIVCEKRNAMVHVERKTGLVASCVGVAAFASNPGDWVVPALYLDIESYGYSIDCAPIIPVSLRQFVQDKTSKRVVQNSELNRNNMGSKLGQGLFAANKIEKNAIVAVYGGLVYRDDIFCEAKILASQSGYCCHCSTELQPAYSMVMGFGSAAADKIQHGFDKKYYKSDCVEMPALPNVVFELVDTTLGFGVMTVVAIKEILPGEIILLNYGLNYIGHDDYREQSWAVFNRYGDVLHYTNGVSDVEKPAKT